MEKGVMLVSTLMLLGGLAFGPGDAKKQVVFKLDPSKDIGQQLEAFSQQLSESRDQWLNEGLASEIVFGGDLYRIMTHGSGRAPSLLNLHEYAPVYRVGVPPNIQQRLVVAVDVSGTSAHPGTVALKNQESFWAQVRNEPTNRRQALLPPLFRILPEKYAGERKHSVTFYFQNTNDELAEFDLNHYRRGSTPLAVMLSISTRVGHRNEEVLDGYIRRNLNAWVNECARVAQWLGEDEPGIAQRQAAHVRAFHEMERRQAASHAPDAAAAVVHLSDDEIDALFSTTTMMMNPEPMMVVHHQ